MDLSQILDIFEDGGMPLLRTDVSDETAWQSVVDAVRAPADFEGNGDADYVPYAVPVDGPSVAGVTAEALGTAVAALEGRPSGYAALADARSMSEVAGGGELTVELVDLSVMDEEDAELFQSFPGRSFRCAVDEFASVEANLSIANMDFHEFADNVDTDGVFRGFTSDG